MALIQCTECGQQVSDKAVACPGCGAPVASPTGAVNMQNDSTTTDRAVRNYAAKLAKQIDNGGGPSFVHWSDKNRIQVVMGKALPQLGISPSKLPSSMSLGQWRSRLRPAIAEELSNLGWEIKGGNRFSRKATMESVVRKSSPARLIKCPTCGSTAIVKISTSNKVGAALLVGVFALGHIAKTFKCRTCGYKW